VDNDFTPYVLVNANAEGVTVPEGHVEDNKIILNLSPRAIRGLRLGNDHIEFEARFSGTAMTVRIPPDAVMAIYARENGQGMIFDREDDSGGEPPPDKPVKPKLRVVK
jgi:stringent starvation protein B